MAEKRTKEKMHQTISEVAKPTMGKTIRQYKTPSACVALSDLWPRIRQPTFSGVERKKRSEVKVNVEMRALAS